MFSTLCDALEYLLIKIYNNLQLKFSSFWFPAQTSLLTKSKTSLGESQPSEQMPFLELYKDMVGWGWCHWRQIYTWDEYGSHCPLTNLQPLCLKQRSEMFAHLRFYQRRDNKHQGNHTNYLLNHSFPLKINYMFFLSKLTLIDKSAFSLILSVQNKQEKKEEDGLFFQFSWQQQSNTSKTKCRITNIFY